MKKMFNCLMLLFSVFVCFFFCAVLPPGGRESDLPSCNYRFTFISPFANAGYWGSIAYGMAQADDAYHTNTKFVGFMESDAQAMSEAIRSEICPGPDGIITSGDSDPRIVRALEEASAADIPVVLIGNDNADIDRLCYIGADNYEMGRLAGKDMTENISHPLYAAVIIGNGSSENQQLRLQGFQDELALHPDCHVETVLEANYSLLTVREKLPGILEENPEINGIFCAEGYSSIVTGELLDTMGKGYDEMRVVVSGNPDEILKHIASGRYYSTIIQESDIMGKLAVEVLKNYQEGTLPEKDVIYIENISISKENLEGIKAYESEGVTWHLYNGNLLQIPQSTN